MMKKNQYSAPELYACYICLERPVVQSNRINDEGNVNLNPSTMQEGDGSEAVKAYRGDVWDYDWSR